MNPDDVARVLEALSAVGAAPATEGSPAAGNATQTATSSALSSSSPSCLELFARDVQRFAAHLDGDGTPVSDAPSAQLYGLPSCGSGLRNLHLLDEYQGEHGAPDEEILPDLVPANERSTVLALAEYDQSVTEKPPAACDPDAVKLFVGNLPKNFVEWQLKALFETVGPVAEVSIIRFTYTTKSKGSGFVWLRHRVHAAMAIQALHAQIDMGRERPLSVRPARRPVGAAGTKPAAARPPAAPAAGTPARPAVQSPWAPAEPRATGSVAHQPTWHSPDADAHGMLHSMQPTPTDNRVADLFNILSLMPDGHFPGRAAVGPGGGHPWTPDDLPTAAAQSHAGYIAVQLLHLCGMKPTTKMECPAVPWTTQSSPPPMAGMAMLGSVSQAVSG